MRAVVVYESMFGSTRRAAEAVGKGLAPVGEVVVVPVEEADAALEGGADLLVVGGPTHVHGLSRPRTRESAAAMVDKAGSTLALDEHARGKGLREWLPAASATAGLGAAFDTRIAFPLSGHASKAIRRGLRRRGYTMAAPPESFLVGEESALQPGEEERAKAWGERLGSDLTARAGTAGRSDRRRSLHRARP